MGSPRSGKQVDDLLSRCRTEGIPKASLEDRSQDVGGIVHFEHLQLYVTDLDQARFFYCDGLGFTEDPGTWSKQRGGFSVLWFNLGRQQMHIVKRDHAQKTNGYIRVVVQDLALVQQRLKEVSEPLKGTSFGYNEDGVVELGSEELSVTDPWGQEFRVAQSGTAGDFPWSMGIAEVQLPVHPGTSHAIAAFYETVFRARVELLPGGSQGVVYVGPGCKLRFTEDASLGPVTSKKFMEIFSGWHVALYVAPFSGAYKAMEAADLVLQDHPYFDKVHSMEEALKFHQFRFRDIIALEDLQGEGWSVRRGEVIYHFGNEIRSMCHPKYMRALYNRHGDNFDVPEATRTIV